MKTYANNKFVSYLQIWLSESGVHQYNSRSNREIGVILLLLTPWRWLST